MKRPEDYCSDCQGFGFDGTDEDNAEFPCVTCDGTGISPEGHQRRAEARARGKASRRKGKVGEREIVKAFEQYGFKAKRGFQSRDGGEQPDVMAEGLEGYWFEVKRGKAPNWRAAMRQAESQAKHRVAVVITRDDRDLPYAHLPFWDLLSILKRLRDVDNG